MPATRVAIVGAGPTGYGLAVLRAFESAKRKGDETEVELVCFETSEKAGGQWNYSWRTDTDVNGERQHSSQYKYLFINGPKEANLEFEDYSFQEHFNQPIATYPPREVVLEYVLGRANQWDLLRYVRLNTPVQSVIFDETSQKFTVNVQQHQPEFKHYAEEFDYVMVCTGHYSVPNIPEFKNSKLKDGSSGEFDVVILATGYRHHFPFMPGDLRVTVQAWYARDFILGRVQLPDLKSRYAEMEVDWKAIEDFKRRHAISVEESYLAAWEIQSTYMRSLASDYPEPDLDASKEYWMDWLQGRVTNVLTFRDQGEKTPYKSLVSGVMAAQPKTKWIDQFDISVEAHLSDTR